MSQIKKINLFINFVLEVKYKGAFASIIKSFFISLINCPSRLESVLNVA